MSPDDAIRQPPITGKYVIPGREELYYRVKDGEVQYSESPYGDAPLLTSVPGPCLWWVPERGGGNMWNPDEEAATLEELVANAQDGTDLARAGWVHLAVHAQDLNC